MTNEVTEVSKDVEEEYRGYRIIITPWISPELVKPFRFVKAYPNDCREEIEGKQFLPHVVEKVHSDEEAEAMRQEFKCMVDRIMGNPAMRNLTIRGWNTCLGYNDPDM